MLKFSNSAQESFFLIEKCDEACILEREKKTKIFQFKYLNKTNSVYH